MILEFKLENHRYCLGCPAAALTDGGQCGMQYKPEERNLTPLFGDDDSRSRWVLIRPEICVNRHGK